MLEHQTSETPVVEFEEVKVRRIIRGPWLDEVADSFDGKTEWLLSFEDDNGRIRIILESWMNTPIADIGLLDADSKELSKKHFENISDGTILNYKWDIIRQDGKGPTLKKVGGIGIK